MTFRSDINGLRAIAVIAVVLFHFKIPYFNGGFAGVDIFFVISGYLMTSIIFFKLKDDRFSISDFYFARAKRIIPALLVLCVILLALTWFILPPYDYQKLGKHMVGAATFLSNFIFLKDSGYFDSSAHEKWLLHTWSLSVEWQFYIIYPLAIVLLRRMLSVGSIRWVILFLALCSLLLSAFFPANKADAGFYLLPTRAWEMMAGGLVYLFSLKVSKTKSVALEITGLALIFASILFLDASVKWPGYLALVPVLGTLLIITAERTNSIVTGNKIFQYLGTTSYSLYLWHWPIVVGLNLFHLSEQPEWILGGILLSLFCAHLSFTFVEQQWRGSTKPTNYFISLGSYASACLLVTAIGFAIFRYQGIPARVESFVATADAEQKNSNPRKECTVLPGADPSSPMCIFGEQNKIAVIVIGDSHSNATITAVAAAIPPGQGGALFLGADGCMAMMNVSTPYFHNCGAYNQKILAYLNENLIGTPVIIINYLVSQLLEPEREATTSKIYLEGKSMTDQDFAPLFKAQYQDRLCKLAQKRPVYIMQPIPSMGVNVPQLIARAKMHQSREIEFTIKRDAYDKENRLVRNLISETATYCKASTLDPSEYLCDKESCLGSINHRPLYYDDDHLSEFGNKILTPMFKKIWTDHQGSKVSHLER